MATNLDRYKTDLDKLIDTANQLVLSAFYSVRPDETRKQLIAEMGKDAAEGRIAKIPKFHSGYQSWYSEALVLVKQLLPDRLDSFKSYYERPKGRKGVSWDTYCVQDFLEGIEGPYVKIDAGLSKLNQQLAILGACQSRFTSALYDIRQLAQADLFDSEIDAARDLNKNGFRRAAGVVAGVVLEKHLAQVCSDHNIKITKKNPTISDFNEALRSNSVITQPQWRHITHMADIRNICGHAKGEDPKSDQVSDLIDGVDKILKTIS